MSIVFEHWTLYYPVQEKLLRDLFTHKLTAQKNNKQKNIIYLSKPKASIRVLYNDNVTIVKHNILLFSLLDTLSEK